MSDDKPLSEPGLGAARHPATGERPDHHNAAPGVAIPGGAGTDPARDPEPDGEPADAEADETATDEPPGERDE